MALPSLLAQPPSLWELIDTYLVARMTVWKDQWLETAAASVLVVEQFDPDALDLPAIMITGYDKEGGDEDAPFGDGEFHISGLEYPYRIAAFAAFATVDEAKRFAALAAASILDHLRQEPAFGGLQAANGEYVRNFEFDDTELYVRGIAGQPAEGRYTAIALVGIIIYTEI